MKRPNSLHRLVAALAFASLSVAAQAADITVGYQTGIDPTKVPQADGLYEKAIGEKIDWRRFNSGPEVIAALASGDLQLGNIGSSPLAAATSRKLPIVAFIVSAQINAAEALVVRNGSGIGKPEDLVGKKIALLGLAFKPDTDDMREASSLVLSARLRGEGAEVVAYDPVAMSNARTLLPGVEMRETAQEALTDSDAAVLVTEWSEFREIDWAGAADRMRRPLLIDGRNFLDAGQIRSAGFLYEGIGRSGDR